MMKASLVGGLLVQDGPSAQGVELLQPLALAESYSVSHARRWLLIAGGNKESPSEGRTNWEGAFMGEELTSVPGSGGGEA